MLNQPANINFPFMAKNWCTAEDVHILESRCLFQNRADCFSDKYKKSKTLNIKQ